MNLSSPAFMKRIGARFSFGGALSFWYRHYKALFSLSFLIVILIGGWNWYYIFYKYRLSDEEKKHYVEQYFKETVFNEAKFRSTTEALTQRARMHEEVPENRRNFFEGKGIIPKE